MEEPAPRMFWPREIWGQYADELEDFKDPANRAAAVQCLNHMVGAWMGVVVCLSCVDKMRVCQGERAATRWGAD